MGKSTIGSVAVFIVLTLAVLLNAQWVSVNNGPNMNSLVKASSVLFAGDLSQGVFSSTDGGDTWIIVDSGLTDTRVAALAIMDDMLFAGTWGGGVFRSDDNGGHWTAMNQGLTNNKAVALAVKNDTIFAGTLGGGVFVSADSGTSWTAMNDGLTDQDVTVLTIIGTTLFAGTYDHGVFRSLNGAAWTQANNGIVVQQGTIHAYVFAVIGTTLFVGNDNGGGVYRSTNNGDTWTTVSSSFPGSDVLGLATDGTRLFAGTNGRGIFFTEDSGNHWTDLRDASWSTQPLVVGLGVADSTLFCGIYQGGTIKLPITDEIAIEQASFRTSKSGYSLTNNPNPCNPGTTISFDAGNLQSGIISIYSPSGEKLFSRSVNGKGQFKWNGEGRSSGVYFCTLVVNGHAYTKKLALVQ